MLLKDIDLDVPARRRRGRPSTEESKFLETALLATATELFCAKGYSGTTVEEIAAAACIGKKAVYARYKTKKSLFAAVVDYVFPDRGSWNIAGLGEADAELSLEEGLQRRAGEILHACCRPQAAAMVRLAQREEKRVPEIDAVFDHFRAEVIAGLAQYFRSWKTRGQIGEIEPETAARMFMMAVLSDLSNRNVYQKPLPDMVEIALHAENMARLFARGLAPAPGAPAFASFGSHFK